MNDVLVYSCSDIEDVPDSPSGAPHKNNRPDLLSVFYKQHTSDYLRRRDSSTHRIAAELFPLAHPHEASGMKSGV